MPATTKYPAFGVSIFDESDYDHSVGYFAWCPADDRNRLNAALWALQTADFPFAFEIGADQQVEPNHVSRRPTAAAIILRRAIMPLLENDDGDTARHEIDAIIARHGFHLDGMSVVG